MSKGVKKFEIIFIKEDLNFAKYKNENPICIRVICKKRRFKCVLHNYFYYILYQNLTN